MDQVIPEPFGYLLSYGALGVFAFLLARGLLVPRSELDRANERADKAEAQRDALTERTFSDFLPAITEVNRTMVPTVEKVAQATQRVEAEVQRMREMFDRADRGR